MEEKESTGETNLYARQKLIGKIREFAESMKADSNDGKKYLVDQSVVDECVAALNKLSKSDPPEKSSPPLKSPKTKLREKEFIARNSLLTDLFEIEHFRTIRNIFTAILMILFMNNLVEEYYVNSSTKLQTIMWNFNVLDKAFCIWIVMLLSTLLLVNRFLRIWAWGTNKFGVIWNKFWLAVYILYLCAFFYFPTRYVIIFDLTRVCSVIIMAEQLRMIMKTHAFVRFNTAKILENPNSNKCSGVSKYLYFLFAPTLVYRDEYPRTSHIRFKFVFTNFCQVFACIYYGCIVIFDYFLVFNDFGLSTSSSTKVIRSIIAGMVPGIVLFFCANFLLLHSWMNAFAELLRFADRQFYTDWWNSYNFAMYYRTWNIVVHDWLFTYIFRDLALCFPKNRILPVVSVFLLSSIMHDYVMVFVFRFCLPVYLIMFGLIGGLLFFVPQKGHRQNLSVLFWIGLIIGNNIVLCLYSIEWYARKNCPPFSESYLDLFVPRMWSCYRST